MTWQETAKRLRDHPKWEWREGILVRNGNRPFGTQWRMDKTVPNSIFSGGINCIPDLTDWATAGILLGMVIEESERLEEIYTNGQHAAIIEIARLEKNYWRIASNWGERTKHLEEIPGQALAELLLELWG